MTEPGVPAWHQALAYAVTGRRFDELGRQAQPDLDALVAFLWSRLEVDVDPAVLGQGHRPPPDLVLGLGPAQLSAALGELRRRLNPPAEHPVVARNRGLTAEERRLLDEVPPHHGS